MPHTRGRSSDDVWGCVCFHSLWRENVPAIQWIEARDSADNLQGVGQAQKGTVWLHMSVVPRQKSPTVLGIDRLCCCHARENLDGPVLCKGDLKGVGLQVLRLPFI